MKKLLIIISIFFTTTAIGQQVYPFDMQVDGDLQVDSAIIFPGLVWVSHTDTVLTMSNDTIYKRVVSTDGHASTHITAGADEVDGDKLDIDWAPSNYTPSTTPSEADNVDNLTAHLYGIDQELGSVSDAKYGEWAFQDKGEGLTISQSSTWYHITNATNDLYTELDTLGVYISGDTIYFRQAGIYHAVMNAGFSGKDDEVVGVRLYGERDSTYAGAVLTGGQTVHATSVGLLDLDADTWVVPQVRNATDTDNLTFRTSAIIINRIKE